MSFPKNTFVEDMLLLSKILESVSNLMYNKHVIHHSHEHDPRKCIQSNVQ